MGSSVSYYYKRFDALSFTVVYISWPPHEIYSGFCTSKLCCHVQNDCACIWSNVPFFTIKFLTVFLCPGSPNTLTVYHQVIHRLGIGALYSSTWEVCILKSKCRWIPRFFSWKLTMHWCACEVKLSCVVFCQFNSMRPQLQFAKR